MCQCCDQRRGCCPLSAADRGPFKAITGSFPPLRSWDEKSPISHPIVLKLRIRITFFGIETPTTVQKIYYIGCFVCFILHKKKTKTVSLQTYSSIHPFYSPAHKLLQDQDPLKPYQDRYLPVTGRGRPHPGFFSHSLLQTDNSICSAKDVDPFLCMILLTVIISKVTDGQCV